MKKLAFVFVIIVSNFVNAQTDYQPKFFLTKLFYDSISKDEFLNAQKYADFVCEGFTSTLYNPSIDPKVIIEAWIYKQDFSKYFDTTKYNIINKVVSYEYGFHFEYFKIFDKNSNKLIRQLMASYKIGSNQLVTIMDSDIAW